MSETLHIRSARAGDEAGWRLLWREYNTFYQSPVVTETTTAATWARILDDASPIGCLIAEEKGNVLGFINYVIHPRTWSERDTCYMEDLYVGEAARGKGVARALCAELKSVCVQKGLSRVYWHTQAGNKVARILYDRIGRADDFVHYVTPLP